MSGSSEKLACAAHANKPSLPTPEERPLLEMELWDRNDVGCWLLSNGGFFVELVHQLHHNTIDGQLLLKLNKNILQREYGLSAHEADIFLIRLKEDKRIVKEEVNHLNKVDLERCDSKEEGVTSIVHEWSYEEVCLWLLSTGGEKLKLIDRFYLNQINGTQLLTVTAEDLSAWGYPAGDIKSFLWWRDYIAINGYSFKESFNKLFTRPRNNLIARDEPLSDMDSVLDGSDTSSLAEADSFDSFASNETNDPNSVYADESDVCSFDVKRMETDDGVDIVVGGHREERATEDAVDIVFGDLERRETEGDVDIIVGGQSVELVTGREPDLSLGVIPSDIPTDLECCFDCSVARDEPTPHSTGGNATAGEIIHISPAPSRFDAYVEKELKAVREAVDETPGEIIRVDFKMEKQIESVQKIPSDVRKRKAKETQGETIHLSAVPSRSDAYAQKDLAPMEKQIESVQKIPSAVRKQKAKETQGEIIHLSAVPSRFDAHAQKDLNAIREASQTPGEDVSNLQQYTQHQVNLQKQLESAQKIPLAFSRRKQAEQVQDQFYKSPELGSPKQGVQHRNQTQSNRQSATHEPKQENQATQVQRQVQSVQRSQYAFRNRKQKHQAQIQEQNFTRKEPDEHRKQEIQSSDIQTSSQNQQQARWRSQSDSANQFQKQSDARVRDHNVAQGRQHIRQQKQPDELSKQDDQFSQVQYLQETRIINPLLQAIRYSKQENKVQSVSVIQFGKHPKASHRDENAAWQQTQNQLQLVEFQNQDAQPFQVQTLQEIRVTRPLQSKIRLRKQKQVHSVSLFQNRKQARDRFQNAVIKQIRPQLKSEDQQNRDEEMHLSIFRSRSERNEQVLNQDPSKQRQLELQPEQEDQQRCPLPSNRCMQQAHFGKRYAQNQFAENIEKALSTQEQADCFQPVHVRVQEQSVQCLSSQYQIRLDPHRSQSRDLQIRDGPHTHSQVAQHQRKQAFHLQQLGSQNRFVQEQKDTQQQKRFAPDPHSQSFDRSFLQQEVQIAPDPWQAHQRFQASQSQNPLPEERIENPLPEEREQFQNPLPEERFENPLPEERERFKNPPEERFIQSWIQFVLFQQSVEQDYLFCIQNQNTATWVLFTIIAYAAANLDQKESSKTPGGFGMREMVQVA